MKRLLSISGVCVLLAMWVGSCAETAAPAGVAGTLPDTEEELDTKPRTVLDTAPATETQSRVDGTAAPDATETAFPPCTTGEDCDSGYCLSVPTGGDFCTQTCIEDCPEGWLCKAVSNFGPDVILVCVPDVSLPCQPCERANPEDPLSSPDCYGSKDECIPVGTQGDTYCAPTCESYLECPEAYGCIDGHCIPSTGSCVCTADVIEDTRPCTLENEIGTCFGVETCTGPNGWEECTAKAATVEICDGLDNDCDGAPDNGVAVGAPCVVENAVGSCPGTQVCSGFPGYTCDGPTPALELCDGLDNDCDGETDEGYPDFDADGICNKVDDDDDADSFPDELDCEPLNAAIHPGADELCNGLDDDCDDQTDESFPDLDGDSQADCVDPDDDGDGVADEEDCDPLNALVYPSALEACDAIDNNCNGTTDEGHPDFDADGACNAVDDDDDGDGVPDETDCEPLNAAVHPGADEVCNGIDDDCDQVTDDGFLNTDNDAQADCVDADDDGDGVADEEDCEPLNGQISPSAPEICDALDNNCNGTTDEGHPDFDNDGACNAVDPDDDGDLSPDSEDCAPLNAAVSPFAAEICNDVDDDCDQSTDEGFPNTDEDAQADCVDPDDDGDGVADDNDCEPLNADVYPSAAEICNGLDDNCDDVTLVGSQRPCSAQNAAGICFGQETCAGEGGWQGCTAATPLEEVCDGLDNDCDGDIDDGLALGACTLENQWGTCPGQQICAGAAGIECAGAVPSAEVCDGLDNDCDGTTDNAFPDLNNDGQANCIDPDDDGDGVGDEADCKPSDAAVFPGAPELCNGLDDNCNSQTDEGHPDLDSDGEKDCVDPDIDGDGDPNEADCAPENPAINAAAIELCDGADNNCNDVVDESYENTDDDDYANCVDPDDDNDGFADDDDNCPLVANPDQIDVDEDNIGDACDLQIPGTLHTLTIRTESGGLGVELEDWNMTLIDTLTVHAAGYDEFGLFVGDQTVVWSSEGLLDPVPAGPAKSVVFTPATPLTNGIIRAESLVEGVSGDVTGTITVQYPPVGDVSLTGSLIYADKSELVVGTGETTFVYVELIDDFGQPIIDEQLVALQTSLGDLSGNIEYLGDGLYRQSLTVALVPGVAVLSGTVNGQALLETGSVEMVEEVDLLATGIDTVDCSNIDTLTGKNLRISDGTVTINTAGCGPFNFGKLRLLSGGILTHSGCSSTPNEMHLRVTELRVDASSKIDVQGKGYAPGNVGPDGSAFVGLSGGHHGGQATADTLPPVTTYDAVNQPIHPGGGGSNGLFSTGGCGGGVARITVTGDGLATINGTIDASGADGFQQFPGKTPQFGSGAGGTVHISAKKILGTGTIRADGGSIPTPHCKGWSDLNCNASRHGGGGGRIALTAHVLMAGTFGMPALFDAVTAYGGSSPESGYAGAGTIWLKALGEEAGTLIVDNGDHPSDVGTPIPIVPSGLVLDVTKTTLTNYGAFQSSQHVGTQVSPQWPQGDPNTLLDDVLITVLGNDLDTLYFAPAAKVDTLTEIGATYRGVFRVARLELRGQAQLEVAGGLIVLEGDLHSNGLDIPAGAGLEVHTLEAPSLVEPAITGSITATNIFCLDCP